MAERIDTEANARRLARAIASDLMLYNEEKISSGADLSEEVAEGRALYEQRTIQAFHRLYDEELAAVGGKRKLRYGGNPSGGSSDAEPSSTATAPAEANLVEAWDHDESGRLNSAGSVSSPAFSAQSTDRFKSFFAEAAGRAESRAADTQAGPTSPTPRSPMLTFLVVALLVGTLVYYLAR